MSQAVMMVIGDCGKESVLSSKLDGVIAVTHAAKGYGYAHNPQRLLQTRKIFRSDMKKQVIANASAVPSTTSQDPNMCRSPKVETHHHLHNEHYFEFVSPTGRSPDPELGVRDSLK